jgi:hypothetical protein
MPAIILEKPLRKQRMEKKEYAVQTIGEIRRTS